MIAEIITKNNKIFDIIENNKIFAVVRAYDAQKAIDISNALIDGGIRIIELSMGHFDDLKSIETISRITDVFVAAGSVITSEQASNAINSGAKLIISPVMEMSLIKLSKSKKIPIITGASTPNEAYNAWKLGVSIVNLFPAKPLGGPEYLKDILAPMPFLRLMPTGGVNLDNFTDYLKAGAVAVGMGNAFYAEAINYKEITEKAKIATENLKAYIESDK